MLRSVQNKRKVNTEKVKSWKMNFTKKFFCENQKGTKKSICQFSLEKDFVKKVKQKFCFKFENKPFWRDRIKATYCQKSSLQLLKIYFSFVSLKICQLWPPFFVYFCSVKHKFYKKTVDFSEFWTRIIGVEGKHADHLTTTVAHSALTFKTDLSCPPLVLFFHSSLTETGFKHWSLLTKSSKNNRPINSWCTNLSVIVNNTSLLKTVGSYLKQAWSIPYCAIFPCLGTPVYLYHNL